MPLFGEAATDAAESETLCMRRRPKRENRESLSAFTSLSGMFTTQWNGQKTSPTVMLT